MIVNCALYERGQRRDGDLPLERAGSAASDEGAFVWLGVFEPSAAEFEAIASEFDLHELAVEDAVKAHQRPKVEQYGDTLLVVVKTAHDVDPDEVIEVGELLLFVNPASSSPCVTGGAGRRPGQDRAAPRLASARGRHGALRDPRPRGRRL